MKGAPRWERPSRFFKVVAGSGGIKTGQAGVALLLAVVLARALGASGYGSYAFAYAVVSILALPAAMGLPQLVVRETARAAAKAEWGLVRGLWRWAAGLAAVGSVVVAAALIGAVNLFKEGAPEPGLAALTAGAALIPLMALGNLTGGALRGLGHTLLGQVPERLLRPGLLLVATLTAFVWFGLPAGPGPAMALHAGAAALVVGISAILLWRRRPPALVQAPRPVYRGREWWTAAWPLGLLSGMNLITQQTDLIMLGLFTTPSETGIYRAAVQVALLVLFGLQAVNAVVAPRIARLHTRDETAALQRIVTRSARMMFLAGFAPMLLYMAAGDVILDFAFGEGFASGWTALLILAGGQLVNTAFGPVGVLLNMTGHERATLRGLAAAAGANIALNAALIPPFGMEGAATATAASLLLWNGLLWGAARRRLGIETTALGRWRGRD